MGGDAHPHLLPLLASEESQNEILLLTAYATAGDLHLYMEGWSCIEELQVRQLASQLLSGIAFLHVHCLIHGDVKPANVFISERGGALVAQLSDFGLAIEVPEGESIVQLDHVSGSHGFIPFEVIQRHEASFAMDLFALGVLLFRLLGALDPFFPVSKVDVPVEYDPVCWEPVSEQGCCFVTQLLALEPESRGRADALLAEHLWMHVADVQLQHGLRASYAPQPRPDTQFHSLVSAKAIWEKYTLC